MFTYSPLSHFGEGYILIENNELFPLDDIKEDVRPILPLYSALTRNQPNFIPLEYILSSFPEKYLENFETSLAIVPISHWRSIVGFVLLDQFQGKRSFVKKTI